MERAQMKASASDPVLKKLEAKEEEQQPPPQMVGGKKLRSDEADVDHAELLRKRRKKPKHDDEDHRAVGGKRRRNSEKKRHPKHNHEVDAGIRSSKERRKKVVRWRLSQELLDYLRTREVMGFLATEMPRQLRPGMTADLFDQQLREEIAAEFVENKEFDAYVLYQYRTKGYAEIQEEVTDGEEEDHRYSQEASRVVKEWFLAGINGDSDINRHSYLQEERMVNEWHPLTSVVVAGIDGDGSRSPDIRPSAVGSLLPRGPRCTGAPRAVTQLHGGECQASPVQWG